MATSSQEQGDSEVKGGRFQPLIVFRDYTLIILPILLTIYQTWAIHQTWASIRSIESSSQEQGDPEVKGERFQPLAVFRDYTLIILPILLTIHQTWASICRFFEDHCMASIQFSSPEPFIIQLKAFLSRHTVSQYRALKGFTYNNEMLEEEKDIDLFGVDLLKEGNEGRANYAMCTKKVRSP